MKINSNYMELKKNINEKERQLYQIEQEIKDLKVKLAELVLSNEEELFCLDSNLTTIISIKFNNKDKLYDYIWDYNIPIKIGDTVYVPNNWREGEFNKVIIQSIRYENLDNTSSYYKHAKPLDDNLL